MLSAKDVVKAHKVLSGVVVDTPLEYDHYLSEKYQAKIYLKKENAQRVRSFKIRGAYYAISQLSKEERERGVRDAEPRRYRNVEHRAGHHRKLPDAYLPAERARGRAADRRHLRAVRPKRPSDRNP